MASKTHSTSNEKPDDVKKRKLELSNEHSDSDCDITSSPHVFPRFYMIEPAASLPLTKCSPFLMQKFLQCRVGSVHCAKKLQSGSILVEVSSFSQASTISKLDNFADIPVKVTPHRTLNSSRGLIRCRDLRDCEEKEVLDELQAQRVSAVKHIISTRNGKKEPTNTFVLTFDTPDLPKFVKVGYLRVEVEPYIPNPLRCFSCQKFGHGKATCKRPLVCARCGQEGHEDKDCSSPYKCANCSGAHPAYSRDCPQWRHQVCVTKVKFEKGVSFREAEDIVRRTMPVTPVATIGASFAAKARTVTTATGTQTDITWPQDKLEPTTLMVACFSDRFLTPRCTTAAACQTEPVPTASSHPLSFHAPTQPITHSISAAQSAPEASGGLPPPAEVGSVGRLPTPATPLVPSAALLAQPQYPHASHVSDTTSGSRKLPSNETTKLPARQAPKSRPTVSRTSADRHVTAGGSLQKGQQGAATANPYNALADMDVGAPDDIGLLPQATPKPPVRKK